jgi:hypothetical protein
MKNKNLGPIFVQSIFALTVFAAVTYAQTITPLPARQAAEAASSLEIGQSVCHYGHEGLIRADRREAFCGATE